MSRRKKKLRKRRPVPIPKRMSREQFAERAARAGVGLRPAPMPSWEALRWGIQQLALERGEFAGYPMPLDDLTLRVSPQVYYRHGERLDGARTGSNPPRVCTNADVDETVQPVIVNEWWSPQHQGFVVVYHESGKAKFAIRHTTGRGELLIGTLGAVHAWDLDAELRAMTKLRELVTEQAWKCYVTTGNFLESSKRSGVVYMFRRLRPTLAIGGRGDEDGMKILAALCLHPLAYYEGSWAGAMVPTDDVVSHLMLMRADEHRFWRMANQHPAWTVSSGL